MALRRIPLISLLLLLLLAGCQRETPLQALEQASSTLQDNLEAKDANAVLEQLHPQFLAQQQYDRDWAKRTMALLFLRHRQVQVIALGRRSELDPSYPDRGYTRAEVTLTGAENLLPDSARHYSVELQWWWEEGRWQLARLDWE